MNLKYWKNKKIRKPVIVKFRDSEGKIVKVKGEKIINKPEKVNLKRRLK